MFGVNPFIIIAAFSLLVFMAVGGLLFALMIVSDEGEARISRRVNRYILRPKKRGPSQPLARDQQRAALFAELDKRWQNRSSFKSLQNDIQAAALDISTTEFVLIQLGVGVLFSVPLAFAFPPFGVLAMPLAFVAGIMVVRAVLRYLGRRRVGQFEDQLPDNLAILAGSVRGGFSLFQALQLIAKEAAEPSKTEFLKVTQEISLGNPLNVALEGMATRIPTEDVDILVTAITMQQSTGGNLTPVLDVVASTIRERQRVKRDIKALTAQQRFSAVLLAALPLVLGITLFIISPKYVGHLFQPTWVLCMPIGAFVMSVIGFVVMRRMADIDV